MFFVYKSGEDNELVKPVKSGLNPYAASYVPQSQQATSPDSTAGKMLSETGQSKISAKSEVAEKTEHIEPEANLDAPQIADDEEQSGDDSDSSDWEYEYYLSSLVEHDGEMQAEGPFDNIDHDVAFLSYIYPNESHDDLVDVYLANGCDVGSAIDMMIALLEVSSIS